MYKCVYVYVSVVTKTYIAAKYMSARKLNVCVHMYEMVLTSMESLIYWRMVNVRISLGLWIYFCWLLVFPIFGCVSEAVWDESLWLDGECVRNLSSWEWEWKNEKAKEKDALECTEYISNLVTWPAPNARFIFAREVPLRFPTHGLSCRHWHVTSLSSQVPETI